MKIAVISDIHGNMTALETVLNEIDAEDGIDQTWVLGDLAAHGPHPAACVDAVRERYEADEKTFRVIGGNTDRYLVTNARSARKHAEDEAGYNAYVAQFAEESAMLDWARAQLGWANYEFLAKINRREISEKVEGYGYAMGYHAVPGDDEYNITDDTPDEEAIDSVLDRPLRLGVYGHIHRQVNRDLGRARLVNPGSVGLSFEKPGTAQYALLTFSDGALTVDMRNTPFDAAGVVALAKDAGHPSPGFLARMMQVEA